MDDLEMYARMGLQAELERLDAKRAEVLALLASLDGRKATAAPKKRRMSAEGKQRIREAVQRRWAKVKAEQLAAPSDATPDGPDAAPGGNQRRSASSAPRTGNRKK